MTKRKPTTHLLPPGGCPIDNVVMLCGVPLKKLPKGSLLGAPDGLDYVDCVGCLRGLVFALRMEGKPDTPEWRWFTGGDTGTSSKTIWSVMTGEHVDRRGIPYDPADFGRCHRLLEKFPQWRARLHEMAIVPGWEPLAEHWDELTALYLEELPTDVAPKLWARMRELRGAPNDERSGTQIVLKVESKAAQVALAQILEEL